MMQPLLNGVPIMRRDAPPKPNWRGKMSKGNTSYPVKNELAGQNVRRERVFPRQNPFGGESHYRTAKNGLPLFIETAPSLCVF